MGKAKLGRRRMPAFGPGRARRALAVVAMAATACTAALADETDGWRDESGGLVHYSGLFCPNQIAMLTRTDASGLAAHIVASCTYQAPRLQAVVEILEPNALETALAKLRANYVTSGFGHLAAAGSAARGMTFVVGEDGPSQMRETIWPIRIGPRDYLLWMNYRYPEDMAQVDLAYTAFIDMLRSLEKAIPAPRPR